MSPEVILIAGGQTHRPDFIRKCCRPLKGEDGDVVVVINFFVSLVDLRRRHREVSVCGVGLGVESVLAEADSDFARCEPAGRRDEVKGLKVLSGAIVKERNEGSKEGEGRKE